MKRLLTILLLAALALPVPLSAQAAEETHWKETCSAYLNMAAHIMAHRQNGTRVSDLMEDVYSGSSGASSSLIDNLILSAYEEPRYSSEGMKQKSIENYANQAYTDCAAALRK